MQHSAPPSPSNLLSFFRPLFIFSLCTLITASCCWPSLYTYCFLFPLTSSGLFNAMLGVTEPGALNFHTFFRLITLILLVFRNLNSNHLPLSGPLNSLLCDLIASTPGLKFSLVMSRTLAAVSSYSSGRAYLCRNFLSPLFLRLTPTLITLRSTIFV